jgi:UDP-N-acetylglucosamine 1-carboxyvinyltransferase
MPTYYVEKSAPLHGLVRLGGAKNVSYKLMIAALLGDEESRILNFSKISDVDLVASVINDLGGKAYSAGERTMFIDPSGLHTANIPKKYGQGSRASTMFVAPLLHKFAEIRVPMPGGDKLGARPLDRHFDFLEALGAKTKMEGDVLVVRAEKLHGTTYRFAKNTHTGTETAIIAAIKAEGKTILENAAEEPEIDDLIAFLNDMGAHIRRRAHRVIEIEGVEKLGGAIHQIMPDQNEAVSYAVAALITKGDIIVENARRAHLEAFLDKLDETGGGYEVGSYGIRFFYKQPLKAVDVITEPHPGFKTDWQPVWSVLLTQAEGVSEIHEAIHPSRFQYVPALRQMGAKIELYNPEVSNPDKIYNFNLENDQPDFRHAAKITGPTQLKACEFSVPDLRAGATILIAGLIAEGTSRIHDSEKHVERGYEAITERLNSMGANIRKAEED